LAAPVPDVRSLLSGPGGAEGVLVRLGDLLGDGLAGRGVLSMPVIPLLH
jgi:hypothetical protein